MSKGLVLRSRCSYKVVGFWEGLNAGNFERHESPIASVEPQNGIRAVEADFAKMGADSVAGFAERLNTPLAHLRLCRE